jgi:hypothetical protein
MKTVALLIALMDGINKMENVSDVKEDVKLAMTMDHALTVEADGTDITTVMSLLVYLLALMNSLEIATLILVYLVTNHAINVTDLLTTIAINVTLVSSKT